MPIQYGIPTLHYLRINPFTLVLHLKRFNNFSNHVSVRTCPLKNGRCNRAALISLNSRLPFWIPWRTPTCQNLPLPARLNVFRHGHLEFERTATHISLCAKVHSSAFNEEPWHVFAFKSHSCLFNSHWLFSGKSCTVCCSYIHTRTWVW
jgi:hypothetical protein